jgi:hypothetical protein
MDVVEKRFHTDAEFHALVYSVAQLLERKPSLALAHRVAAFLAAVDKEALA